MPCDSDKPTGEVGPSGFERLFGTRFAPRSERQPYPSVIGDYEILGVISAGGNGVVLDARHRRTRVAAAVKIIRPDCCTAEGMARFDVEWRALAELRHDHIATLLDCGWYENGDVRAPFYAMEKLTSAGGGPPRDLLDYASAERLGLEDRMVLLAQACEAVQFAHDRGVLHRDLKPGNIPVHERVDLSGGARRGTPRVVDFGLSHVLGAAIIRPSAATPEHEVAGTLRYMAPEQVRGDTRSFGTWTDVHALGLIGYELATGSLPYALDGLDDARAIAAIQSAHRRPACELSRRVDKQLSDLLAKATAVEPAARIATARELAAGLSGWLEDRRQAARRAHAAPIAAVAAVILVSVVLAESVADRVMMETLDWGAPLERWVATMPSAAAEAPITDVRVIALDETFNNQAYLDALAPRLGIDSLSVTESGGFRPLYGLIARDVIERGGAASVAIDISFSDPTPYDEEFVRLVGPINAKALAESAPAVVIGMPEEMFDSSGMPSSLSPALARVSPFAGLISGVFNPDRWWSVDLLGQFDQARTVPSLPAMLYAKCHPGSGVPKFSMEGDETHSHIILGPTIGVAPGTDLPLPPLPVASVPLDANNATPGGPLEFSVCQFPMVLPSDRALMGATTPMREVVDAVSLAEEGTRRLRAWFEHKAVIIGDVRRTRPDSPDVDIQLAPDGRSIAGVYAHAVATQWLMDGRAVYFPGWIVRWLSTFLLATAGALIAWCAVASGAPTWKGRTRWAIGVGGVMLLGGSWVLACVAAFRSNLWMVYPWAGLSGGAIAAALSAIALWFWHPAARARREKGDIS